MKKAIALAFVGIGGALVIAGSYAYVSTVGGFARTLTGAPSDYAVWLLISGMLATITGIFGYTGDHSQQS